MIIAQTLHGECRGEPLEGQVAVCNVIRNRALFGPAWMRRGAAGDRYERACLTEWQFSCWNGEDGRKLANVHPAPRLIQLEELTRAELLQWQLPPDTLHYHAVSIARPESWGEVKPYCQIGDHLFYRGVE